MINGAVYSLVRRMEKDKMVTKLEREIVNFFKNNENILKKNLHQNEEPLLNSLNLENALNLKKDSPSGNALFGYGSLKSDYRPKDDDEEIIIEVKYIRISNNKSGTQYNECDIKNAMSQIIEQAVCKKVNKAILVIIDTGRARDREWNVIEGEFRSMFQQNPFHITLSVVRIRVNSNNDIFYEII